MALAGRQEPRTWRNENEGVHRRISVTSSEDAPVCGTKVPFEELLARELRKSQDKDDVSAARGSSSNNKSNKKPFLKRGARGWWMKQPGAKQKVVKHMLTSMAEDEQNKTTAHKQSRQKPARATSPSSTGTLPPVMTPPDKLRTALAPSQTLSPPVSPIRRTVFNSAFGSERESRQRGRQEEEFAAWKETSLRSIASTDLMGMKRVRQSFEAKQEREANEMAEFEAIERDLAAEKELYLQERQNQQSPNYPEDGNLKKVGHWELPYSSFVSDLREQEQLQQHSTSIFDDSLDDGGDSAFVFDDHSSIAEGGWGIKHDGSDTVVANNIEHFTTPHYGYSPSDLSAVSFDDSVPWDDALSYQPRNSESMAPSVKSGTTVVPVRHTKHFSSFNVASALDAAKQTSDGGSAQSQSEDTVPVSSLVQRVFGDLPQGSSSKGSDARLSNDHETTSVATACEDQEDINVISTVMASRHPPTQDTSLFTLKQKLRGKQKPAAARNSATQRNPPASKPDSRRSGPVKTKPPVPPRKTSKQKATASSRKPNIPQGRVTPAADAGTILPAVIEEKLYELEEEVKFYKAETLLLQKRKDYYDQEVKRLAHERDEFEQYKQEQQLLIEKEWEKERAKMKKEEKRQERQWKLRMNATISHQERKDRGEVESLKAQIVKMQLDEKAHVNKWKAASDNLRQRVTELEEKNRELSDEIKFLEKERLDQWEKYECLQNETKEAIETASKLAAISSADPSPLNDSSKLRTMGDVFAIKGSAEELLKDWTFPREEGSASVREAARDSSGGMETLETDGYNPKRYSLDEDDPHGSDGSWTFAGGERPEAASSEHSPRKTVANAYQWALPDVEDNQLMHDAEIGVQAAQGGEANGVAFAPFPGLKGVQQEVEHPGGKKEILYSDGSRKILFPDGNEKEIAANGHVTIKFTNGDHKELFPDIGVSVYYYYEAQTKLTTYPDNRRVYAFPNQQIETSLPDGTTEIQFADGIKKTIRPNGDEFSVFPDGTTMLEKPDGLREVTLLNQKRIRYFPDGEMACVRSNGQETRVRSDSELQKLMEM